MSILLPFLCSSVTWFRMQFLCTMWPFPLVFLLFIICRLFLFSLTLCHTFSFLTWSFQLISILLQHHISKLSRCFWSTF
jgi:hypothetical protein